MSAKSTEKESETPLLRRCEACSEEFDPRFSRGGTHCFQCSVHESCACADEPESPAPGAD